MTEGLKKRPNLNLWHTLFEQHKSQMIVKPLNNWNAKIRVKEFVIVHQE